MGRILRGRWAVVVIGLLLAVLPLRGLAHELMALPHGTAPAHAIAQHADEAPPCHGGHAAAHGAAPADIGSAPHGVPACSACDLCHGALALATLATADAAPPPAQPMPPWAAPPRARPEPDRFFRPPRR